LDTIVDNLTRNEGTGSSLVLVNQDKYLV